MQAYFICRGHKMWQDRFIQELNAKFLPYTFAGQPGFAELMVRPIELYEIVFPEENYEMVMRTVFGEDQSAGADAYKSDKMKLTQWAGKKMLGAKPFKPWAKDGAVMPITKNGLSILGIGIREDKKEVIPGTKDNKPTERL